MLHFKRSKFDPCVYTQRSTAGIVYLAVVVDDILAAATTLQQLQQFEQAMREVYNLTSLGEPTKLVGLNITVTSDKLTLDQVQFIKDTARDFKQTKCKPVATPIAPGDVPLGQSPLLPPGNRYLSLVGSLLWASITRPDIAVAVGIACTKSKNPTKADLAGAIRILRYLLHTPHIKLTMRQPQSHTKTVSVYVDSAWCNAPKARSRYGYLVCVYGCPVYWETKLTTLVCLSTAEAEYVAAVQATKTALWFAQMLAEMQSTSVPHIHLLEDNQACIRMAENPEISARNRHFAMRMWWLRDMVTSEQLSFTHVPSDQQLADIFTKVLAKPRFLYLRDVLMSGTTLPHF